MNLNFPLKVRKKTFIFIAMAIVLVILLVSLALGAFSGSASDETGGELTPHKVLRGSITASVTGSGSVEPIEQYEIQSIVTGDILEDYVLLGDTVEKDALLYVIDSSSAENNIERAQASYEQQLISYNQKLKNYNEAISNRTVYAPISGVIKEIYVKKGDTVNTGTKLCEIVNSQNLTVKIPFLASDAKKIYINNTATVHIAERNESLSGYVSHVATGSYATESGAVVSDVEITIKNPGALLPGESVTATVGAYACNDFGTIENSSSEIIVAKASGDVKALAFSSGDFVNAHDVIMTLEDDDSYSDIRSSELSLKNSRLSLDDLIEKLDDYSIRSPISGTVISKTFKGGDTLDGNKSSLAIVADMSKLTLDVSVDELDIKNISVGQSVKITADALPDKTFEGVIDTISIIGTSVNGVTVYPVTIVISEYEGLLPGMNVNAEIVTNDASNVLMIPVNAVSRGNLVLVKSDGTAETDKPNASSDESDRKQPLPEAPDGYRWISVELGVSNDDYVEVVSGLSEGDEIYISVMKNTSTQETQGFFGGMGGGMPSGAMGGGMPSGAMGGRMPSGVTGGGMR